MKAIGMWTNLNGIYSIVISSKEEGGCVRERNIGDGRRTTKIKGGT